MNIFIALIVLFIFGVIGYSLFKGYASRVEDSYKGLDVIEDVVEKEPDISEPVISFVKVFKDDPARFKVSGGERGFIFHKEEQDDVIAIVNTDGYKHIFTIKDLKLNITYKVGFKKVDWIYPDAYGLQRYKLISNPLNEPTDSIQNLDWLTADEKDYLIAELYEGLFLQRNKDLDILLKKREQLNKQRTREKLKKLYCEEK